MQPVLTNQLHIRPLYQNTIDTVCVSMVNSIHQRQFVTILSINKTRGFLIFLVRWASWPSLFAYASRQKKRDTHMDRYSIINEKNKREIVLLRGSGCKWRRCTFCDYHLDFSSNAAANFALNQTVLGNVTGIYGRLEVINSGSFTDLDDDTVALIRDICDEKAISTLFFECYYADRGRIPALRSYFAADGIDVKIKTGVETFDADFRENVLHKGIAETDPAKIAQGFDQACLLFGLTGQTEESMRRDIATGLRYFQRICINIMTPNTTPVKPDQAVIRIFREKIYPEYKNDPKVDILMENTDFGVGGKK
jgi:hypothetical protein